MGSRAKKELEFKIFAYKSLERCLRLDFAAKVFERFAISRLDLDIFSGDMLVFLQRMEGVDIKQVSEKVVND